MATASVMSNMHATVTPSTITSNVTHGNARQACPSSQRVADSSGGLEGAGNARVGATP